MATEEAHAFFDGLPGAQTGAFGPWDRRHHGGGDDGDDECPGVDPVDDGEAEPEEKSRECGTNDAPHLKGDLHHGRRGRDVAPFHQTGHRGHARRIGEAVDRGRQRTHQVERKK